MTGQELRKLRAPMTYALFFGLAGAGMLWSNTYLFLAAPIATFICRIVTWIWIGVLETAERQRRHARLTGGPSAL